MTALQQGPTKQIINEADKKKKKKKNTKLLRKCTVRDLCQKNGTACAL